jgi:hypothetical protein
VESYVSDARSFDVQGDQAGYDWALLRLYNPLGSWLGYFGYNGYSDSPGTINRTGASSAIRRPSQTP